MLQFRVERSAEKIGDFEENEVLFLRRIRGVCVYNPTLEEDVNPQNLC